MYGINCLTCMWNNRHRESQKTIVIILRKLKHELFKAYDTNTNVLNRKSMLLSLRSNLPEKSSITQTELIFLCMVQYYVYSSCGVSVVSSNTSESWNKMAISLPKIIRDIFTLEPNNHQIDLCFLGIYVFSWLLNI